MDTNIQIRVDKKIKKEVQNILEDLGLNLTSAISIYLHQIIRTKSIPFHLITENGFTHEQEVKILQESEKTMKALKKGKLKTYKNAEEMMKDILK